MTQSDEMPVRIFIRPDRMTTGSWFWRPIEASQLTESYTRTAYLLERLEGMRAHEGLDYDPNCYGDATEAEGYNAAIDQVIKLIKGDE